MHCAILKITYTCIQITICIYKTAEGSEMLFPNNSVPYTNSNTLSKNNELG